MDSESTVEDDRVPMTGDEPEGRDASEAIVRPRSEAQPVYDLAYHHKRLESMHHHTPECEPQEGDTDVSQFLRCLRAELDQIRKEAPHEAEREDAS